MLKLAVKHYLKSVGDHYFVPNPDCLVWNDSQCLDISVLKRPKWLWQHPVYTYDHFGIDQLLDTPLPNDKSTYMKAPEPITPNFEWTEQHHGKAKISLEIASLLSLELDTDETLSVSIKFEDVMKASIDFVAVQDILNKKKVNLSSDYVRNVSQDSRNVICMVTQYIYLTKPTDIKVLIKKTVDESGSATNPKAKGSESGEYSSNKVKTITFDAGTRLAFDFVQCLIKSDGSIVMMDRSDLVTRKQMLPKLPDIIDDTAPSVYIDDNFNFDAIDSPTKSGNVENALDQLQILKKKNGIVDFIKHVLKMTCESRASIYKLENFLTVCQQRDDKKKKVNLSDVMQIGTGDIRKNEDWLFALRFLGINASADISFNPSSVDKLLVDAVQIVVESIRNLDFVFVKNVQGIIDNYQVANIRELYTYIRNAKMGKGFERGKYEALKKDSSFKKILMAVGITDDSSTVNEHCESILIILHCVV